MKTDIGLPDSIKTRDDAYIQGVADGREQIISELAAQSDGKQVIIDLNDLEEMA